MAFLLKDVMRLCPMEQEICARRRMWNAWLVTLTYVIISEAAAFNVFSVVRIMWVLFILHSPTDIFPFQNNNCATSANSLRPSQCPIPSASHSYCFAMQHKNGTVDRGCSLTTQHQKNCLTTNNCRICSPEGLPGCNDMIFDSTGTITPAPPTPIPPPTPPPVTLPTIATNTPPIITNPPPITIPSTTMKPGSATSVHLSAGLTVLLAAHFISN